MVSSEPALVGLALALGADRASLTQAEVAVASRAVTPTRTVVVRARSAIDRGEDPLGEALCALRTPATRRPMGATYTPAEIVSSMTAWAASRRPARVVDPGAGSGRFVVAAGRALANAELVAVELDPTAALLARAHLAAAGLGDRSCVVVDDYRRVKLPAIDGPTVFLGNPPYVRHHDVAPRWKRWLTREAKRLGLRASQLAGLHAHFFLATALRARPGDAGVFVSSAEWLDVRYGALVRELLLGPLGGQSLDVLAPTALPFPDADTTAAIACFVAGDHPKALRMREVPTSKALTSLGAGQPVPRARLASSDRWTPLLRPARARPAGLVELGALCRVHRGQVTGSNRVWIAGAHSDGLPASVLFPTITRARELFAAGDAILDGRSLSTSRTASTRDRR
jgi:hypothetical protein